MQCQPPVRAARRFPPCPRGHQNLERRHGFLPWPSKSATPCDERRRGDKPRRPFRPRRGRGTSTPMPSPPACAPRAPPPDGAPADARRFPLLRDARSRDGRRARRAVRRERRRQDQSARSAVAVRAGPRAATRRTRRLRAHRRRRRLRDLGRDRGRRRDRTSSASASSRPTASGRPSARTASTARRSPSARAFADHLRIVWLTPAMDGLFIGPASERRRFLDRLVLAIDPQPRRARQPPSSARLRGRNRLLEEGGRNPPWLDAIEREAAELGVAVAAARRECVDRLEGADRARARRRLALSLGRRWRWRARSRRWPPSSRRSPPRSAIARCCATAAAATPPPGAR